MSSSNNNNSTNEVSGVKEWNNNMFSNELKAAINDIVPVTDKDFDRHDFDPIVYLNEHFPSEQSLNRLDNFMNRLKLKIIKIDEEIVQTVRLQSTSGNKGREDLENAKKSILHLLTKIRDIKSKAIQSEQIVTEICKDIKTLDYAKKNLTTAITTLKRLHMMVLGVDQLREMAKQKQYSTVAKLLEATKQISDGFQEHSNSPKIKSLNKELQTIRNEVKDQIYNEFRNYSPHNTTQQPYLSNNSNNSNNSNSNDGNKYRNACYVLNALGDEMKKDFLRWFCDIQLESYKSAFSIDSEHYQLESIERRFAWLARQLSIFRQEYSGVFPPEWSMDEQISYEFCVITRISIGDLLMSSTRKPDFDVKVLVKTLKVTLKFENMLYKMFESQNSQHLNASSFSMTPNSGGNTPLTSNSGGGSYDSDQEDSDSEDEEYPLEGVTEENYNSKENIHKRWEARQERSRLKELAKQQGMDDDTSNVNITQTNNEPPSYERFKGIISSSFDPYMDLFTAQEERFINEKIEQFLINEPWKIEDETSPHKVLGSSVDMVSLFIDSMRHCSGLSNGEPYYQLYLMFKKYLSFYAQRLASRVPVDIQRVQDINEDKTLCLIINTGEYCRKNVHKLEESFKTSISERYKEKINLHDIQNEFSTAIAKAAKTLVSSLESRLEPHFINMTKMDWVCNTVDLDNTPNDNSSYATEMALLITSTCAFVSNWIPDHYGYYCDLLAASMALKFVQSIYKCNSKISETGSQSISIDVSLIKDTLGHQRKGERYKKLINREFSKAEHILKVLNCSEKLIVSAFCELFPNSSENDFSKILDLKGYKSSEKSEILAQFSKQQNNSNQSTSQTNTPSNNNQNNGQNNNQNSKEFFKKFIPVFN